MTGVLNGAFETIGFDALDGRRLLLHRLQPRSGVNELGPVLMIAGTSVRAGIFSPPLPRTLPRMLSDEGYDVWLLDWRASIDLPATDFTLDDAAVYDHPAAVATICAVTKRDRIKAIVHCQGSTSFMMSIVSGLLPQVSTVVSNSVALHPHVPKLMWLKMPLAMAALRPFVTELNAQWGLHAPGAVPKLLNFAMRAVHHECNNSVCKMSSFMYGTGFPTLWRHENLTDATHEWLKGEVAQAPMSFFLQIQESIEVGELVSSDRHRDVLPATFTSKPPQTDARFAFVTGERNATFLPSGMAKTFEFFDAYEHGRHSFRVLPDYGHLDVFLGKNAATEVFPMIIDELGKD